MQYQVFVQNPSEQHFVASIVNLPGVAAEGQTKEEAIAKAKAMLEEQLAIGEFVTIEVRTQTSGLEDDPWIKHMGLFTDDPTFDDFLAEVAAYRRQADEQEVEA
ncbi:MAG: type II toxin-antitoxin system HicB family antitoxin [Oculatellaceae cyanobacterium Prado106]|jgi:predicted RNase H-like HicB family nuclease|nr:type II toxin-antitoxin system HicB family antitoxin [Oculatellaceae cyanobacterium Prado106]